MTRNKKYSQERRQDIQFRRSLLRFSIVFVVVFVSGVVTRGLVAQIPISVRLDEALSETPWKSARFHKPRIVFRRGWIPVLGLEINRVDWQDEKCASRRISLQNALVVLDFFQLLQGEIQPGQVNIEFLDWNYAHRCGSESVEKKLSNPSSLAKKRKPKKNKETKWKSVKRIKKFFSQDLSQLLELKLSRLKIENFKIHIVEELDREFSVEGRGSLRFRESLLGDMELTHFVYNQKKLDFLKTKFQWQLSSEKVHLEMAASIREGDLQLKADLYNQEKFPLKAELVAHKVPTSPIVRLFNHELFMNYLWLSCQVSLDTQWSQLLEKQFKVGSCKVDGPYGEALVQKMVATPEKLKSLKIEFDKLQLDKILKDKSKFYFSGVFANYGTLSARLNYEKDSLQVTGHLLDSDFIFSNNNLRDLQRVQRIPFEFVKKENGWRAQLSNIKMGDGEFEGRLSLQTKEGSQSAFGKVSIHKLRFNPRIYKLILNSEPTDVRIYGQFSWFDNKITDWDALVATSELQSEMYNFKNLKVRGGRKSNAPAQVKISVAEGALNEASPLVAWLRPTQLNKKWKPGPIPFEELSTRLLVRADRSVQWQRGYIRLKNNWQLSSEGLRNSAKKVKAWLQWDRPDGRFMRWQYEGSFFEGLWQPITPWVQSWLSAHSEFLQENQAILYDVPEKAATERPSEGQNKNKVEKVKKSLLPKVKK